MYGGYDGTMETITTISVVADKVTPATFKTKLPKKEYDKEFLRGIKAAEDGWERDSKCGGSRAEVAFLAGFDSVYKDVHTEHCCSTHGCKYGDADCTVESGQKKQSYPCERCHGF